jgi:hypothetical protein
MTLAQEGYYILSIGSLKVVKPINLESSPTTLTYALSQPHFEASVRMRLTFPKVGTWSPLVLPKVGTWSPLVLPKL